MAVPLSVEGFESTQTPPCIAASMHTHTHTRKYAQVARTTCRPALTGFQMSLCPSPASKGIFESNNPHL